MRPNRTSWKVIASSVLVAAAFAPAAFAQDAEMTLVDGTIKNGLSSEAFRRNALTTNAKALEILLLHPLDDDLFRVERGYIGRQLHDPKAKAVMKELLACALDRSTELHHPGEGRQAPETWRGELGLCQSWHHGAPDEACQELVTACLMARVNAQGMSIPLLLRGEPPSLSARRERVRTETRFRESPPGEHLSEGWPIGSFSDPNCPRDRECNWAPAYVGKCDSGEIQLAIQNRSTCDSMTLRVCAGIHGCLGPDSGYPQPDDLQQHHYSKHLQDKQGACVASPLRFRCPTDVGGYYSVMTWPRQDRVPTVVKVDGSGAYPAMAKDVFKFPEGAFYGNLFTRKNLIRSCEVNDDLTRLKCTDRDGDNNRECSTPLGENGCSRKDEPLPSPNTFACYSFAQQEQSMDDDLGVAALNYRMCNSPDAAAPCFGTRPQRCHYKDPAINHARGSHCDSKEDGIYSECRNPINGKASFKWVIATYLNIPCDFIRDDGLCAAMRQSLARGPAGQTPVSRGKRGCGGCAADAQDDELPSALIAALVVFLLYWRRRPPVKRVCGSRRITASPAG